MRNQFRTCARRLALFACCLFLFCCSSCGKIGDPLPPIPRAPLAVSELTAIQQGDKIILNFPVNRTTRTVVPARIDVYRLIESAKDPQGMTEEAFASRAAVIASIPGGKIQPGASVVSHQDEIEFRSAVSNPRYRYCMRFVNVDERPGDFSNYAFVTPLIEIAAPPVNLKTELTQTELVITWEAPTENLSSRKPASVAGYNLYRQSGQTLIRLNNKPLTEPRFVDRQFQFDTSYQYLVRALSLPEGSKKITEALESNPSIALSITPKDTFAPAAPESITIASVNGIVSLFWPANAEPDVAGYNIYRADSGTAPPEKWVKLNARLHTPTTFRDDKVRIGAQYFYQITAVDTNGNESPRSATLAESVNP